MKLIRPRSFFAVICNLITVILSTISVLGFILYTGEGNMSGHGVTAFRYFTVDSNVLAALSCLAILPFNLKSLATGKYKLPKWAVVFKYIGTTAITVTFLTVICFLGPMQGFDLMFTGNNLYMHLICPVLCLFSLLLCESGAKISFWQGLSGVLPNIIYGVLYFYFVVIAEIWPDFYGFNYNGMWALSVAAMFVGSFIISLLMTVLYNSFGKLFK
ncbi:MAG: hypothetical protein Q4A46_05830 [Clostridia bacterium]|nr:hypothetical protein [Clostridia bacterium]